MQTAMKHDYSLAALSVLSLTPPQQIDVAHRCGYKYVGLRITKVTLTERQYDLVNDSEMMQETLARLEATGIKVLDVELFRLDPATEPESYEATLDTSAELGAKHIICQLPDPDFDRKSARFAKLCDLAAKRKLGVSLEFPYWTDTGSLEAAEKVLRKVKKKNAGILVDMLHFGRSKSSMEHLAKLPREWFRMAHLCDAAPEVPDTFEENMHTVRSERTFPGEGRLNVKNVLACLPDNIPYVLEIPREAMTRAIGPEATARLALQVTRAHVDNEW
jgi:sugar phosphate isomerase/epimerase